MNFTTVDRRPSTVDQSDTEMLIGQTSWPKPRN